MPQFFLPEIDQMAEENPMLYEVLYRIQQAISAIPINSGGAAPVPAAAIDPATGLPLTDASGQPLSSVPVTTNNNTNLSDSESLPAAQVNGNEAGLYVQTDPTGGATSLLMFGGRWQAIAKIINAADIAGHGPVPTKFLTVGAVSLRGLQFDDHGRASSSFFSNATDNTGAPFIQPLTQSGTSTRINIAASTWQFGGFQLSFNSGSVDPGVYGTFIVYCDDQQYNGGAEVYLTAAPNAGAPLAKRGRFYFGTITTAPGGGGVGGGAGNGGGGGTTPR